MSSHARISSTSAPQPRADGRPSPWTRALRWLTRGAVPVDGCPCVEKPAKDPAPARDHAAEEAASFELSPVKWGNFR